MRWSVRRAAVPDAVLGAILLAAALGPGGCAFKSDLTALEQKTSNALAEQRKAGEAADAAVQQKLAQTEQNLKAEQQRALKALSDKLAAAEQTLAAMNEASARHAESIARLETGVAAARTLAEGMSGTVAGLERDATALKIDQQGIGQTVSDLGKRIRDDLDRLKTELSTRIQSGAQEVGELRLKVTRIEEALADFAMRYRAILMYQRNTLKDQSDSLGRSVRDYDETIGALDNLFPETKRAAGAAPPAATATPAPGK